MVRSRRSRSALWPASTALALAIDAIVGDEPLDPHPVALFGKAMSRLECLVWQDHRLPGLAFACGGVAAATLAGRALDRVGGGPVAAGYVSIAGRGLWDAAASVHEALVLGDLARARELLPALVGRDPAELSATEIARAVVESVAENTVDAIVAPALFAAAFGAAGAFGYRAVNTLDSMVGYRDAHYARFGWAAARLDDVANLVPARVTAVLVGAVRPRVAADIWRAVRRQARAHPSPNAGVAEAAFAVSLGVQLGGRNSYRGEVEERPLLGSLPGRAPEPGDIAAAVACSRQVTALLFGLLFTAAVCAKGARRRARPRCRPGSPTIDGLKSARGQKDIAPRHGRTSR